MSLANICCITINSRNSNTLTFTSKKKTNKNVFKAILQIACLMIEMRLILLLWFVYLVVCLELLGLNISILNY